jgi:serine/threonine protein kinase
LHIIMQYCENGDLGAKIRAAKKSKVMFAESQILDWFAQLALAVYYIHRRRILHRDLKSRLVTEILQ